MQRLTRMCALPRLLSRQPRSLAIKSLSSSTTASITPIATQEKRPDANAAPFNPRFVAENPATILHHLRDRRASPEILASIPRIQTLHASSLTLASQRDKHLQTRNSLSAEIAVLMRAGASPTEKIESVKAEVVASTAKANEIQTELNSVEAEMKSLFAMLPNILDPRVPIGDSEAHNVVVKEFNTDKRKIGKQFQWHDDIGKGLGGLDNDAAVAMSGSRFTILKGDVARLERALQMWMLDLHSQQHGYTEVSVPLIVTRSTLEGTGQLPKFENDLFKTNHKVAGEDSFLIPTAEVPLTNLLRGSMIERSQLPLKFVALSPCFRAEAGAAGRDTRGFIRQHQFYKVELVVVSDDQSDNEHHAMRQHCEAVLEGLQLPYRSMMLCSGDIGNSARLCYDLEVWMPAQQAYREISSISNCGPYQAARLGLRYRVHRKSPPQPCHTMNGSGLAIGRTLAAVLENFQNEDGSVTVPAVLRPYLPSHMHDVIKPPPPTKQQEKQQSK